ncbi:AAEL011636-PA [Aedes aegypti]|uniref:AAEL011636-PA n=1 Tax=Aedes aegypti TaxID=7159 RepID=Q16PH7_AEDAE|nr:AAEL011636-PA [Aedes aegypti]
MDAYLKLEWSKNNRRSEQRLLEYFAIDFSQYEEDIFNLHINETDTVHQLGDTFMENSDDHETVLNYPIDPRTGREVRQLEIDTTKAEGLYDDFPSGSMLSQADHQHCLKVLNRINMRLGFESAEDCKALSKYHALMKKVDNERMLFESFVKNYFNSNLVCRKSSIDKELDDLVVAIWKGKVGRILTDFANKRYMLSTAVMWLNYKQHEHNVRFEPVSEDVVEFGVVKNIYTESLLACNTLRRNQRILDAFFEDQHRSLPMDDSVQVNTVLQQDEDIRFVINSGTLCYLLNCVSNMEEQWMVPFRIEMIGGRNVIFIDKKLQPIKMPTHDRNMKAHKYLVRSFTSIVKKENPHNVNREADEKDSQRINSIEYKAIGFDEYLRSVAEKSELKPYPNRNSCLQLWTLQEGDDQYRFLIRFRMDCYESLRKIKFYINISVKLEYQTEFGAEQMTKSELIHEWARQYLRPNSKTLRLRINAVTHVIISHHYLELKDIEEELKRSYDIEPANLFTNLWQTLKILLNFPPGDHILQHDMKNKDIVNVLSNDNSPNPTSSSINLVDQYSNVEYDRPAVESYDWIPIDKSVITQMHRENTLLPCTFPHWISVKRITPRGKLKHSRPPPTQQPVPDQKPKKKKSRGNRVRRKLKEREAKKQQRKQAGFVEEMQQSLNQFAPYEGPSRNSEPSSMAAKKDPSKMSNSLRAMERDPFDYHSYVKQAQKDDQ